MTAVLRMRSLLRDRERSEAMASQQRQSDAITKDEKEGTATFFD